jgi:hypothetical protein
MTLPTLDPVAVASVAALVTVLVQVILTAGNFDPVMSNRWGPVLAIVVGLVLAEGSAFAAGPLTNEIIATAAFTGLAGGLSAMGVHNVLTKSVVGTTAANVIGVQAASDPAPEPLQITLPPATV